MHDRVVATLRTPKKQEIYYRPKPACLPVAKGHFPSFPLRSGTRFSLPYPTFVQGCISHLDIAITALNPVIL